MSQQSSTSTQRAQPKPEPCCCAAYPFPHRAAGGLCLGSLAQPWPEEDELTSHDLDREYFEREQAPPFEY